MVAERQLKEARDKVKTCTADLVVSKDLSSSLVAEKEELKRAVEKKVVQFNQLEKELEEFKKEAEGVNTLLRNETEDMKRNAEVELASRKTTEEKPWASSWRPPRRR